MSDETRPEPKIDIAPVVAAFRKLNDALVAAYPPVMLALAREMARLMDNARRERKERDDG